MPKREPPFLHYSNDDVKHRVLMISISILEVQIIFFRLMLVATNPLSSRSRIHDLESYFTRIPISSYHCPALPSTFIANHRIFMYVCPKKQNKPLHTPYFYVPQLLPSHLALCLSLASGLVVSNKHPEL
jgi:hypothetical protein